MMGSMWLALAILLVTFIIIQGSTSVTAVAEEINWPDEQQCSMLETPDSLVRGWCSMIIRSKGNCVACHAINITPWPQDLPSAGNIAPPLVAMQARFPDKFRLRAQIRDATASNPNSTMPPFGKHKILTDQEIDDIVELLYSI